MEIVGKVILIPGIQQGTSKTTGKPWTIKTFVIETLENYPRKVAIEMFGEDRINNNPVEMDQIVTASVDVESREVNGRWFTSVRAWKVAQGDTTQGLQSAEPVAAPAATQPAAPQAMVSNVQTFDATPEEGSELPF